MPDDLDLPVPDLDAPLEMPSWRVRASAFRDPVTDAEKVAEMLSLPVADAQRIVVGGVYQLAAGASWREADGVAEALRSLGARAVVEDANAATPSGSSTPPAPPSMRPSASPSRSIDAPVEVGDRTFWVEVPWSFLAPVLGRGSLAIVGCALLGGGAVVAYSLPLVHLKLIFAVALGLAGVGLLTETFTRLAQAASSREPGEAPSPHFEAPEMTSLIVRGLATTLVSALLVGGLYSLMARGFPSLTLGLVAMMAWAYWPMGLAVQGISGRLLGIFDVVGVVRGVIAAPLEYATVVVVSFLVCGGISVVLGGAILAAGSSPSPFVLFLLPFLYFALLAYLHGVLGYLMGALVAARNERFAYLVGD